MKFLFIVQNLYTLGGIQRVITMLTNKLLENEQNEVYVLMPETKTSFKYFDVNSRINIVNYNEIFKDRLIFIKYKFSGLNRKIGIFNFKIFNKINEFLYLSNTSKRNLVNFINKEKFDYVIGVGGEYTLLLGSVSHLIKSKSIGWQHSTFPAYFNYKGKALYGLKELAKTLYPKLDAVLVLSNKDKEIFDLNFNINSIVQYNPTQLVNIKSNLNENNLLFVGRLNYDAKGFKHLIQIIKYIYSQKKNIKCNVIGEGPDRKKIEKEIKENGLEEVIFLKGQTNDVYEYYKDSSILLQTSNWEGFGVNIIEAMACGVPCVSFHNFGPDEIIEDKITGILIDKEDDNKFAENVIKLLDNKNILKEMSMKCLEAVKKYDINNVVNDFIDNLPKENNNE